MATRASHAYLHAGRAVSNSILVLASAVEDISFTQDSRPPPLVVLVQFGPASMPNKSPRRPGSASPPPPPPFSTRTPTYTHPPAPFLPRPPAFPSRPMRKPERIGRNVSIYIFYIYKCLYISTHYIYIYISTHI